MNPRDGIGKLKVRLTPSHSDDGWYWVVSTVIGSKTIAVGKVCKTRDNARVAARKAIADIARAYEQGVISWE